MTVRGEEEEDPKTQQCRNPPGGRETRTGDRGVGTEREVSVGQNIKTPVCIVRSVAGWSPGNVKEKRDGLGESKPTVEESLLKGQTETLGREGGEGTRRRTVEGMRHKMTRWTE